MTIGRAPNPYASAFDQAFVLATLFGIALSLSGAGYVFLLRAEFGSETFAIPHISYVRALLLAGAIMLMPLAMGLRHGLLSTVAILAILLCLAFVPKWLKSSLDLIAASVWIVCAFRLQGLIRRSVPSVGIVLAFGIACGGLYGFVNLSNNYATPIAFEAAIVSMAHHDTLFHAAIAESLTNVGVASIGVDGIVPLTYHVFSHRVIGGFADWLGLPALHGYGLYVAIVGVPVLVTLLLQGSTQLLPTRFPEMNRPAATFSVLLWLVLGGAIMWHSYYGSESYNLSLWFLILAVLIMERLVSATDDRIGAGVVLVLLALLVGMAALSKISVGFVLGTAVASCVILRGRFRPSALLPAFVAGILPAVAVYLAYPVSAGKGEPTFTPFAFFTYERPAIYALLFASVVSWFAFSRLPADVERRILVVALACGMWAGVCASFLLNAPHGAQYYFSDPGSWLGLFVIPILGIVPRWLSVQRALPALVSVLVLVVVLLFLHDEKLRGIQRLDAFRSAFGAVPDPHGAGPGEAALDGTAVGAVVSAMIEHSADVDAVVIDADFAAFWKSQNPCWAASLLVPALTGKPMLQGMVPESYGCNITPFYGFRDYNPVQGRAPSYLEKATVCTAAVQRGFVRVLAVSEDDVVVFSCK